MDSNLVLKFEDLTSTIIYYEKATYAPKYQKMNKHIGNSNFRSLESEGGKIVATTAVFQTVSNIYQIQFNVTYHCRFCRFRNYCGQ